MVLGTTDVETVAPRTGVGFSVTKTGWHHVVTDQKPHHADDCVPDCMLNPDRLRDPRATLAQLNYEPPIWGLHEFMALRRTEQQLSAPWWKRSWHRIRPWRCPVAR